MSEIVGQEIRETSEPIRIRSWQEVLTDNSHHKDVDERVDSMTYVKGLNIKEIDMLTLKRFIKFCRFNTKNDWGIGIKVLLDYIEYDAKIMMLYERISKLEVEFEGFEIGINKLLEPKKEEKKEIKTFGGKKDE